MPGPARADAVVLCSGGLDSCVTLALAARDHAAPAVLHASYGQRTAARERQAFERIADFYGIPPGRRRVLDLAFLGALGGSALTDPSIPVPRQEPGPGIPVTYVPFRNAHLLAAAVSWAELLGAEPIFIGAVEEDSSGYPDCRESFLAAFERAAAEGTGPGFAPRIVAPLVHRSKAEIVRLGVALGAPLELTWSCYEREDLACGECESCRLRLRGFRDAGVADPIPYASGC
ncbi:MAG: 7-cyano-7-deazaguanine synthase QueC [Acidobacteria bacterium]|nr:MAG: 7-cyano-7-deazaguanine synthase QueC [Acidobacteriota bacterium]